MKQIIMTKQDYEDQMHVNMAYTNVKEALANMAQVQVLDGELHRLLRKLYEYEDTLYQYVASVEGAKVI